MDQVSSPANRRRLIVSAIVVVAAWTAFGLLSITHFFLGKSASGSDPSFSDLASHILIFYWGWALVTPLVLWSARDLTRRLRRRGADAMSGWVRAIAIAPVVMLAHACWYITVVRLAGVEPAARLTQAQFADYLLRHGGGDLATYVALVGAALLIDARRRAREREIAASALESRLAKADAELLRWQLQPHFLFNSLNTVSTLVLKGEAQSADRAIGLIARWLRDALSQRADAVVTLADELTTVRQYVAIEMLRFGDALRLDVQADAEALSARIPGLIVQPLVENAIRHGFATIDDGTPITISAQLRDSRLRVAVRNRVQRSGEGFSTIAPESDGFGLRYVRERLANVYGDTARLELITDGLDVIATLDVPASLGGLQPRMVSGAAA